MEFTVVFQTRRRLVKDHLSSPGMDMLDDVRENIGDVSLDMLTMDCPYFRKDVVFTVSEELARQVPHFKVNTKLSVNVPEGYLGRYLKYETLINYNHTFWFDWINKIYHICTNRYVKRTLISVNTVIDDKQAIKDWIADGCPNEWGTD